MKAHSIIYMFVSISQYSNIPVLYLIHVWGPKTDYLEGLAQLIVNTLSHLILQMREVMVMSFQINANWKSPPVSSSQKDKLSSCLIHEGAYSGEPSHFLFSTPLKADSHKSQHFPGGNSWTWTPSPLNVFRSSYPFCVPNPLEAPIHHKWGVFFTIY